MPNIHLTKGIKSHQSWEGRKTRQTNKRCCYNEATSSNTQPNGRWTGQRGWDQARCCNAIPLSNSNNWPFGRNPFKEWQRIAFTEAVNARVIEFRTLNRLPHLTYRISNWSMHFAYRISNWWRLTQTLNSVGMAAKWKGHYNSGRKYNKTWEEKFACVSKASDGTESTFCKLCRTSI